MNNISLYRRWRSQTFEDILGQNHITRTLQNVIKDRNLLSHAYLFCGPRGTGKTSMARIFAKALNCLDTGAAPPCNRCENCMKITSGYSLDVMEIDAASNTSVDMVREHIIDKVHFAPMEGGYKIYIIDEVHKLSNASFNALLKTLEEPPGHVVFILATTHPHELLPTILSRCQRFDFRRIKQSDMVLRMRDICQEEGYTASESALDIIADVSSGSMRDALVVLEQAVSFSGGEITASSINNLLGLSDQSFLFYFSQLISEGNMSEILHKVDDMIRQGRDLFQFVRELVEYYRKLMLIKSAGNVRAILEVTEEYYQDLEKAANLYDFSDLLRVIKIASDLMVDMKDSFCQRALLEVGLVKMSLKSLDESFGVLRQRIENLESALASGESVSVPAPPVSRPAAAAPPSAAAAKEERTAAANLQVQETPPSKKTAVLLPGEPWQKLLQAVKSAKMTLYAIMADTEPEISEGELTVKVKDNYNFHKEQLDKNASFIREAAETVWGAPVKVRIVFQNKKDASATVDSEDHADSHRQFVREVMDIFGGKPL